MSVKSLVAVARGMLHVGAMLDRLPMQRRRPTFSTPTGRRVVECVVCFRHAELYMAKRQVWEAAGLDKNENCCLLCLEQLLGRPLTIDDLTDAPVNTGFAFFFLKGVAYTKECENKHG